MIPISSTLVYFSSWKKKKTSRIYFSLQLLSFFPFKVKFLKSCLYYFFPFTPFILELIHVRFCSQHFTYQYVWVAKSRGDCSCKVLFYRISSFLQPLNNAVPWASDSFCLYLVNLLQSHGSVYQSLGWWHPNSYLTPSLRSSLRFPLGCLIDVTNLTRLKQNSSCPILSDPNCFSHSLPCLTAIPFF